MLKSVGIWRCSWALDWSAEAACRAERPEPGVRVNQTTITHIYIIIT